MEFWNRAIEATKTVIDYGQTFCSYLTFLIFNKALVWVYEVIILNIINLIVTALTLMMFPIIFIFLLPFSLLVSVFKFTEGIQPKPKSKRPNEIIDLINNK